MLRIGNGFDIHRLEEGIPLILGGVHVPFEKGSKGHSDGDVVTHAIIDSLLGAAGLGDIGVHFPPSDPAIKGINSLEMLKRILVLLKDDGWTIGNVDATIVLELPKISPFYKDMRETLAKVLQVDIGAVSVKCKTAEKLGAIGEGKAIAAYAVCLLIGKGGDE